MNINVNVDTFPFGISRHDLWIRMQMTLQNLLIQMRILLRLSWDRDSGIVTSADRVCYDYQDEFGPPMISTWVWR